MNLKIRILTAAAAIVCLFVQSADAQNRRGMGLNINDPKYRNVPTLPNNTGLKADNVLSKYTLRPYCPTPGQQGATSACVGWAAGFGAMSITRAVQDNITDRTAINQIAHSAYYLYNKIKLGQDCKSGALLSDAMTQMKTEGVCRANRFDNVPTNCSITPPQAAVTDAQNFKIKDFCRAFSETDVAAMKIFKLRQLIQQKNPVVIGMQVLPSFYNVPNGQKQWTPAPNESPIEAHMVLVGYDNIDNTFEFMNSWGATWGDGGFIKIKCSDAVNLILFGYVVVLEERQNIKLSGAFAFRTPAGYKQENGQNVPNFAKTPVKFNSERGVYETIKKDWQAGDAMFQLTTTNVPKGKYVYVFSYDPTTKIEMHYPLSMTDSANFMPSADAEIVMPSADQMMLLSEKGEDNLCILYADQPIKDFTARLDKIKNGKSVFADRLKVAFGDLLANPAKIRYNPSDMSFDATFGQGEATVVPLVLSVTAQ